MLTLVLRRCHVEDASKKTRRDSAGAASTIRITSRISEGSRLVFLSRHPSTALVAPTFYRTLPFLSSACKSIRTQRFTHIASVMTSPRILDDAGLGSLHRRKACEKRLCAGFRKSPQQKCLVRR